MLAALETLDLTGAPISDAGLSALTDNVAVQRRCGVSIQLYDARALAARQPAPAVFSWLFCTSETPSRTKP